MRKVSVLDLNEAMVLIEGAKKRSAKLGVPMCIAIADDSGALIAFIREDDAKVTSSSIAIDKAFTAAGARNATAYYADASVPGGPAWGIDQTNGGHFTVIRGGIPVVAQGRVVGGVGVSGGTSHQDHDVAVEAARWLVQHGSEFSETLARIEGESH